jgi:hypothetical protein
VAQYDYTGKNKMMFYEIIDDLSINRWVPHVPDKLFYRKHENGVPWKLDSVEVPIATKGPIVDFTKIYLMPLVTERLGAILRSEAERDVELIPAKVWGETARFYIVHILWEIDCLDANNSEISPDGMIWKLVLHRDLITRRSIFRLANEARIIVCERIKNAMEQSGASGAQFEPVEVT